MITWNGQQATISAPGSYVLDRDATWTGQGPCINIACDNVSLDMAGHRIEGNGTVNGVGVQTNGHSKVSVVDTGGGWIRGFDFGVQANGVGSAGANFLARGLTVMDSLIRAVQVEGDSATVEDCDVRNVLGRPESPANPTTLSIGIEIDGDSPRILRNNVEEIFGHKNEGVGVSVSDRGLNGVIEGNVIVNSRIDPPVDKGKPTERPSSYGVWVGGASDVITTENVINRFGRGIAYSSPPTGIESRNQIYNCPEPTYIGNPHILVGPSDTLSR